MLPQGETSQPFAGNSPDGRIWQDKQGGFEHLGLFFFPRPSAPSPQPRLAVAVFGDASALSFGHHKEPEEEKCELRRNRMCQKQARESLAVISVGVGWEIWTVPQRFGYRSAIPYCHFRTCIWERLFGRQ